MPGVFHCNVVYICDIITNVNKIGARIEFIDIIKGLAIILVVKGHTSPNITEVLPYKSLIYKQFEDFGLELNPDITAIQIW